MSGEILFARANRDHKNSGESLCPSKLHRPSSITRGMVKEVSVFISKAREVLQEHDVDTFAELNKDKFLSAIAQCPFLSRFQEDTLVALLQALKDHEDESIGAKWETCLNKHDLEGCEEEINKEKALGEEMEKAGLSSVVKDDKEVNPAHLLVVYWVMQYAQSG